MRKAFLATALMCVLPIAAHAQGSFRTQAGGVAMGEAGSVATPQALSDESGYLWTAVSVAGVAVAADVVTGGAFSGPLVAMLGESAGVVGALVGRGAAQRAVALRGARAAAVHGARAAAPAFAGARAAAPALASARAVMPAAGAAAGTEAAAATATTSEAMAGEVPLIGARIHTGGGGVTTVRVYGAEVPEPIGLRMIDGEPMPCMRFTVCGKMAERPYGGYGFGPGSGGGMGPGMGKPGRPWLPAEGARPPAPAPIPAEPLS